MLPVELWELSFKSSSIPVDRKWILYNFEHRWINEIFSAV